jgi:hypothetical protein
VATALDRPLDDAERAELPEARKPLDHPQRHVLGKAGGESLPPPVRYPPPARPSGARTPSAQARRPPRHVQRELDAFPSKNTHV